MNGSVDLIDLVDMRASIIDICGEPVTTHELLSNWFEADHFEGAGVDLLDRCGLVEMEDGEAVVTEFGNRFLHPLCTNGLSSELLWLESTADFVELIIDVLRDQRDLDEALMVDKVH